MSITPAVETSPSGSQSQPQGCGFWALLVFAVLWAGFGSGMALFISWTLGQTIFEGSLGMPDFRWLVALGYGIYLAIPFTLLAFLVKHPRSRRIFQTFFALALLVLLLFPSRFLRLTNAQLAALIQIVGLVIYLAGILAWSTAKAARRGLPRPASGLGGISLSLSLAGALLIPWALWGALGSPLDIVLDLFQGLLAGLVFSLTIHSVLFQESVNEEVPSGFGSLLLDGLVVSAALLILTTALSQNGNEWLAPVVVPILGWLVVIVSRMRNKASGKKNHLSVTFLVGLPIAWQLLWVDADELMAVIAMSAGELMSWVSKAVLFSVGIAFLITLFCVILYAIWRKQFETSSGFLWFFRGTAILALGFPVVAYLLWGQVGFFGERLFVVLKDQADVSSAEDMGDYLSRRDYVYHTLLNHAEQSQAGLRSSLDQWHIAYKPYYLVNALEVRAGPLVRLWLLSRKDVDRVLDSPVLRPLPESIPPASGNLQAPTAPEWNLTMIGADQVWRELGITGEGIVVGNSDTGVQVDHPEFAERYRGYGGQDDYNWYDPWNRSRHPVDIGGHGTHTTGTIVGKNVGVAPGATWIGCVNLGRNLGNSALYLECMQFMLAPFPLDGDAFTDGDPSQGAQILNNSWGCPWVEGCDPGVLQPAVKALRDAGVFVVASAGNSGYSGCGSVQDPIAIYDEVFSVGAVGSGGQRTDFSSVGPVEVDGSLRSKPDIMAPGEGILSSYPGSTYYLASGTSMAGPHLVGVVALMWSANPSLIGDIEGTEEILRQTAHPYTGSVPSCLDGDVRNAAGAGIVDAYAAVKAALAQK